MKRSALIVLVLGLAWVWVPVQADDKDGIKKPPAGFTALFNGKDISNWKEADSWKVEDGILHYTGKGGKHLITAKNYKDFELWVDWKITKGGDSGIYLRGQPQVQIWDNKEGSGGIWDQGKKALKNADKKVGEWNHFEIKVEKGIVTVHLNGELVVDKHDMKFKKAAGPVMLRYRHPFRFSSRRGG